MKSLLTCFHCSAVKMSWCCWPRQGGGGGPTRGSTASRRWTSSPTGRTDGDSGPVKNDHPLIFAVCRSRCLMGDQDFFSIPHSPVSHRRVAPHPLPTPWRWAFSDRGSGRRWTQGGWNRAEEREEIGMFSFFYTCHCFKLSSIKFYELLRSPRRSAEDFYNTRKSKAVNLFRFVI